MASGALLPHDIICHFYVSNKSFKTNLSEPPTQNDRSYVWTNVIWHVLWVFILVHAPFTAASYQEAILLNFWRAVMSPVAANTVSTFAGPWDGWVISRTLQKHKANKTRPTWDCSELFLSASSLSSGSQSALLTWQTAKQQVRQQDDDSES